MRSPREPEDHKTRTLTDLDGAVSSFSDPPEQHCKKEVVEVVEVRWITASLICPKPEWEWPG